MARINAVEQADVIKDIIVIPQFHFHSLQGRMKGFFENERPFTPCYIDEIAAVVRIVEIREVSPHYE